MTIDQMISDRIRLRMFNKEDALFLLELCSSPNWLAMLGKRNINNLKSAERHLKNFILKEYSDHQYGFYAIESIEHQKTIGLCGITLRNTQEIPDLGFGILPQYAGQGFSYEAARLVLQHTKDSFSFEKIDAFATPTNIPSQKLLKKLGFVFLEEIFHTEFHAWVKHYRLEMNHLPQ
ncbi:MAG: RimJ/RimL family protein N-acetyltransferase [Pseudopedobacter saltans]|uniref:RimJ/RimL family protein N-acetyltransferase n=1 Tax=Pseudopedobacter saltans TaxID=151895 RepID=A0A2W5EZ45_9SPHI|nr:MAG: RimJ/RimL family protein N-acetyltransferase [Pseudopedobacter saltans]